MPLRHPTTRGGNRVACAALLLFVAFATPGVARGDGESPGVRTNGPMRIDVSSPDRSETASGDPASTMNDEPLIRRPAQMSRGETENESGAMGIHLPKSGLFDTFWPMLVVLGVIVACLAAVRKWLPQATRISGGSAVNILARQYVSSKQSLCLVKVGKRVVLVGITPEAMTTLTEIDDPEEIASLAASLQRGRQDAFSSALSRQSVAAGDVSIDEDADAIEPSRTRRSGPIGETETRIRDLVGRIRAMSVASPQDAGRRG